jgi:hypothetical protein
MKVKLFQNTKYFSKYYGNFTTTWSGMFKVEAAQYSSGRVIILKCLEPEREWNSYTFSASEFREQVKNGTIKIIREKGE